MFITISGCYTLHFLLLGNLVSGTYLWQPVYTEFFAYGIQLQKNSEGGIKYGFDSRGTGSGLTSTA